MEHDCKCEPGKQACKCQAGSIDYLIAANDIGRVRQKCIKLDSILRPSPYPPTEERGPVQDAFFKALCPRWKPQQTIETSRAIEKLLDLALFAVKNKK